MKHINEQIPTVQAMLLLVRYRAPTGKLQKIENENSVSNASEDSICCNHGITEDF